MVLYGTTAVIISGICFVLIQDSPKVFESNKDVSDLKSDVSNQTDKMKATSLANAIGRILKSPVEYIMSLGFLACLLCKGVMSDWMPIYLITVRCTVSLVTGYYCKVYLLYLVPVSMYIIKIKHPVLLGNRT